MKRTREIFNGLRDELTNSMQSYDNGNINALDTLIYMRDMKKQCDDMQSIIKEWEKENFDDITTEINEYQKTYKGYKFEVRNGGVMYDFKHIPEWNEKNQSLKDFEAQLKNIHKAKMKGLEVDPEFELPNIKHRASSIVIKAPKI